MLSFNSALFAIAAEFIGPYAPYQGIAVTPASNGGVFIASTDHGKIACIAHDRRGSADESVYVLPSAELVKCCKGIKTAERELRIDGPAGFVTTYRKTSSSEVREIPITRSQSEPPPLPRIMQACIDTWGQAPALSATAGRYSSSYIEKAIRALSNREASIVFSAFDGGPLRIQTEAGDLMILVMPQTAAPVPHLPAWLSDFAQAHE